MRFRAALARCASGDAPPNVVVMQMHAEARSPGEVEAALAGTAGDPAAAVARWAALFDGAVGRSAEVSVALHALHALGDPALLRAATHEVVDFLRRAELLGHHRGVLEIGCGIGRFQAALASRSGASSASTSRRP